MSAWCVYGILTPTDGPWTYFKIGQTRQIDKRVRGVQTGCPYPIENVLHLPVADRYAANNIESGLHKRLAAFHSSGEWFRFNLSNPADKIEFREACHEIITPVLGEGWRWSLYDLSGIRAIGREVSRRERIERVDRLAARLAETNPREARRIMAGLPDDWPDIPVKVT